MCVQGKGIPYEGNYATFLDKKAERIRGEKKKVLGFRDGEGGREKERETDRMKEKERGGGEGQ